MFSSTNKRLVAAAKFLVEATKDSFVIPNFVAVIKSFFPCKTERDEAISSGLTAEQGMRHFTKQN